MNFFSGWEDLGRLAVVGSCAYLALVVLLRGFGKRSLTKLNAFDLVVTIALGSILATILLDDSISLATGVGALLLLLTWQYCATWLACRSGTFRQLLSSEPRLVAHDGALLVSALRAERLDEEDIMQAIRNHGHDTLDQVRSVVLEPDGTLSVVAS